jgi:hypothetical protein
VGSHEEGIERPDLPDADQRRLRSASHAIECYGIHQFFADIDVQREYWRDGDSCLHYLLEWASLDGWQHIFGPIVEFEYRSSADYRQRHITASGVR